MIPKNLYQMSELEVHRLLRDLDKTEQRVIRLRFGIPSTEAKRPLTLQGVVDTLGLTLDDVRRIEIKAMEKLGWVQVLS